jgi:hypothetical protein
MHHHLPGMPKSVSYYQWPAGGYFQERYKNGFFEKKLIMDLINVNGIFPFYNEEVSFSHYRYVFLAEYCR